jgi:arylformamidase
MTLPRFVASLGLLMTDSVALANVEIFAEPHKGTGRPFGSQSPPAGGRLVELSRIIGAGMVTYPGLPGSPITPYLIREASRERYAPGTGFWLTWAQRPTSAPVSGHGDITRRI